MNRKPYRARQRSGPSLHQRRGYSLELKDAGGAFPGDDDKSLNPHRDFLKIQGEINMASTKGQLGNPKGKLRVALNKVINIGERICLGP
jgi:hypothetical protein